MNKPEKSSSGNSLSLTTKFQFRYLYDYSAHTLVSTLFGPYQMIDDSEASMQIGATEFGASCLLGRPDATNDYGHAGKQLVYKPHYTGGSEVILYIDPQTNRIKDRQIRNEQ